MYQHMSAEVGRTRQHDLRVAAAHRRLVAEAMSDETGITVRLRSAISRVRRAQAPATTPAIRPAITPAG